MTNPSTLRYLEAMNPSFTVSTDKWHIKPTFAGIYVKDLREIYPNLDLQERELSKPAPKSPRKKRK